MAGRWEHFPHGADVGIRGRGASQAEAFAQAARALTGVLVEPEDIAADTAVEIACEGRDADDLEARVNAEIRRDAEVKTELADLDAARARGAMALFGEKYGDQVRVISVGGYSKELCGGTHANAAGDIGLFRIISEGGIAAGVRRIEAVTGGGALAEVKVGRRGRALARLDLPLSARASAAVTALFT